MKFVPFFCNKKNSHRNISVAGVNRRLCGEDANEEDAAVIR